MSTKTEKSPTKQGESKQKSGKEEEDIPKKIHSANNWEGVDLGDDNRKKKFLRLMGAAKKDHHGKIIIGDHDAVHARSKDETVHINEDLEDQFKQGLEHKMAGGFKGHLGLGFHKDDEEEKEGEDKREEGDEKASETEDKGDNCETDKSPEPTKKEDGESSQESPKKHKMERSKEEEDKDESVKKKMKMNFVKASS